MLKTRLLVIALGLVAAPLFAQDEEDKPDTMAQMLEAAAHLQADDFDKAAEGFQAVVKVDPRNGQAWQLLGYSLHAAGKLDEAISAHTKAAEFEQFQGIGFYNLGCAYSLMGDKDKAFDSLNKALDADFNDISTLRSDSDLKNLHEDDRFSKLLARAREKRSSERPEMEKNDARLVGIWAMKSGKRAGADSERMPPSIQVTKKSFIIPSEDPDQKFVMSYNLDRSKSPMQIDYKIQSGPVPEGAAQGIIKVEKKTMTLCYDPTGQSRPTNFESTVDNGYFLFVMQRQPLKMNAKRMVGVWDIESGSRAGEDVAMDRLATEGGVKISEDTITLPAGPDKVFVMKFNINHETTPAEIDMEIKSGPAPEGSKALGIIRMRGGKIMLCYDSTGEKRPEKFKTTDEDGFFMFTLTKKKEQTRDGS